MLGKAVPQLTHEESAPHEIRQPGERQHEQPARDLLPGLQAPQSGLPLRVPVTVLLGVSLIAEYILCESPRVG